MVVDRFGSVLRLAVVAALCTACSGTPTGPSGLPRASATPVPGSLAGVTVVSFSVLEYAQPGGWNYAPLIRIAAGPAAVIVTRVRVTVPGVPSVPDVCSTFRIEHGTTSDLFGEFYGDWEFTLGGEDRSTGKTATAILEIRNDANETTTLSVDGPIVPGGPPGTYGQGTASWPFCS
jgi:hypothetical protein